MCKFGFSRLTEYTASLCLQAPVLFRHTGESPADPECAWRSRIAAAHIIHAHWIRSSVFDGSSANSVTHDLVEPAKPMFLFTGTSSGHVAVAHQANIVVLVGGSTILRSMFSPLHANGYLQALLNNCTYPKNLSSQTGASKDWPRSEQAQCYRPCSHPM
jgi:hypothetical protein